MSFNLSDWALKHRSFVWFLMIVSMLAGAMAYVQMGREEDPAFSIKTMVITASLPGASAEEVLEQVTTRIEDKLEELEALNFTKSESMPGVSVVYVELRPSTKPQDVEAIWLRIREMMADIRADFPKEFGGFQFNDNFGDVFGTIYAFTGEGYSLRALEDQADKIRDRLLSLENIGKVNLIGTRDEAVFIEFETRRLAALELDSRQVIASLADQNAILPAGVIRTQSEQIIVEMGGRFTSAKDMAAAPLRVGDVYFTLADVAVVREGFIDPPNHLLRFNGQPAIGLAIGMQKGANILDFGAQLHALMAQEVAGLPLGVEAHLVADQPEVVDRSVGQFITALVEAVVIVLAVSFISLGMRAGFVVTLSIPLVLALTFCILDAMGITLQRISLGALIIALGLLVDDAMIAIETMITRLEEGDSIAKAASHAWTSIAFPMLTGTLITVAGFIPIGFNDSMAGEYTNSLFWVIAISLVLSWVVAVLFAPLLGAAFLPKTMKHHGGKIGWLRRGFHRVLDWSMHHKWLTIGLTCAAFILSVLAAGKVEQQFFPTTDRTEILVDVTLAQNSPISATADVVGDFEAWLQTRDEPMGVTSFIGQPAPRFILTHDAPTPTPYMAQLLIHTADIAARDRLRAAIREYAAGVAVAEIYPKFLEIGPPVGKPVQYRVRGADLSQNIAIARQLAALLQQDARLANVDIDTSEPVRVVRVALDYDQLRLAGLTTQDVADALATVTHGAQITQLQDDERLISVVARGGVKDRSTIEALQSLQLVGAEGRNIPLASLARLEWDLQPAMILQRKRVPTVTIKAAVISKDQPPSIVADLAPAIAKIQASLPAGYVIEAAGITEESTKSQGPILAVVPLMLLIMLTLVMVQMQSFRLSFIVCAVAPLALIGVVGAMLLFGAPLGFVAALGVLALIGILIRNSIILIHEVEVLIAKGHSRWAAVFEASDSRARPILLTAAAASLALIPIARQIFWGPMAIAMMGGIIIGTLVTLLFAPALYCAVYGVKKESPTPPTETGLG